MTELLETKRLEKLARRWLPPAAARFAKRCTVGTRYRAQAAECRAGFERHGERYRQHILFVAGLPKSGTTWLERMLASFPGFSDVLIPDVAAFELAHGGSDRYDLPPDIFDRFHRMLVLTKMHVHGSPHNVEVLRKAGVRYVVLFRDLRDVAVSNVHYVQNTPWHPEHRHYRGLEMRDALEVFARRTLEDYADWVRSWAANRDPNASLVLRYEQMLEDPTGVLRSVADHFELGADDERIERIVEANSFKRLSSGRERGQEPADGSFFRKGVAGDWVNHFTPELRESYKRRIGRFLIEFGYERDESW